MDGFDSARLKINRAEKHIADLEEIIGSLPDRYLSSIEIDPQGHGHSIKYEFPDFEAVRNAIALIAGDAIHNLKTALDYCWITATGDATRYSKFPVVKDATYLDSTLRGIKIDITRPALFKWIASTVKPYPAGNEFLVALHNFDIADKHRIILPVIGGGTIESLRVEDQYGPVKAGTWRFSDIATFYIDFTFDVKIHDKGKPVLDICFGDMKPLQGSPILETLGIFRRLVIQLVDEIQKKIA